MLSRLKNFGKIGDFLVWFKKKNTPTILFDAGANGEILMNNFKALNLNPSEVKEIFISHLHWDHTGGLQKFLDVNPKIEKIYVPESMGIKNEVILKTPTKIYPNIFSTGELDKIEQSMGVITEKGIVLIVGCSHPSMKNILTAAERFGKIYGIIGGMHGFSDFELFKDIELICPTHCTQHKKELKTLYPSKYIEGGVGRVIEI